MCGIFLVSILLKCPAQISIPIHMETTIMMEKKKEKKKEKGTIRSTKGFICNSAPNGNYRLQCNKKL
ncbi:hypothetical protein CIPAW_07G234500 [Carya illinoinensis]|uniref:Secreted protein n=1 Tax=Carya illinoinensis TaxID=32201 RepID=A0A8T1Q530_CARIL|nr:hypothetical protein CIPAW_07G234500 [Carya illinoinensis]